MIQGPARNGLNPVPLAYDRAGTGPVLVHPLAADRHALPTAARWIERTLAARLPR